MVLRHHVGGHTCDDGTASLTKHVTIPQTWTWPASAGHRPKCTCRLSSSTWVGRFRTRWRGWRNPQLGRRRWRRAKKTSRGLWLDNQGVRGSWSLLRAAAAAAGAPHRRRTILQSCAQTGHRSLTCHTVWLLARRQRCWLRLRRRPWSRSRHRPRLVGPGRTVAQTDDAMTAMASALLGHWVVQKSRLADKPLRMQFGFCGCHAVG